jgi:hypothetical protein
MIPASQRLFQHAIRSHSLLRELLLWFSLFCALSILRGEAVASITNVVSDASWRATSPVPSAGWNTSIEFDDSVAAGWEYAFKSPQDAKIWIRSNLSSEAPSQAWFRKVFTLPAKPTSASGTFIFDDDGELYINGTLVVADPGGGATSFNLQLDTNLFVAGENLVAVHGIDTHTPYNNISVEMALDVPPETILIGSGVVWKYLDDGTDQGIFWRSPFFNDTGWASGPAPLGYGDGDEATTNSFGPDPDNKYVTTYYRHSFALADASIFTNLQLRLLRDDGAIVYLNGLEMFRCNLPTGAVTSVTLAQAGAPDDGTFWVAADLPVTRLRNGTNVLAVEIHQNSVTSSDISFDLELVSNFPPVPGFLNFAHWPAPIGGNGHFYEAVPVPAGLTWDAASARATNRAGYLATITSPEENTVVFQLVKDRPEVWLRRPSGDSWGPWLGGLQPAGSAEPNGGWSWVTGEPFAYTHWADGQPNNNQSNEDRLHFIGTLSSVGDRWNDDEALDNRIVGYVVEYEQRIDPVPIVEFKFDETGPNAPSTGVATNAARFLVGATTSRDFHSTDRRGISGLPGDRAFDNSVSSGMGSSGDGGRAVISDVDAADDLLSLTLQGWFRAEGAGINDLARLITKQASSSGFLLLGTGGDLQLEINNTGTTSTGTRYADAGDWVYFAVTYDGTATANNVRFYKGTRTNSVILLETRTLNQGRALANAASITIGNANSDGSLMRPFDGRLDDVRVFGDKLNSSGALTLQQLEWLRNKDVQNLSEPVTLSATHASGLTLLQWPTYPGGFHLESTRKLDGAPAWSIVTNAVLSDGSQFTVRVETSNSNGFFRLAR